MVVSIENFTHKIQKGYVVEILHLEKEGCDSLKFDDF